MKFTQIEHVGIVVKDLDQALDAWGKRLGLDLSPGRAFIYDNPGISRRAYIPLTDNPNGNFIVLYQPYAGDLKDDLDKYGEGLHHLCLEVEDLTDATQEARQRGCDLPVSDYSWPDEPFMGGHRKPGLRMEWVYLGNERELNNVRVQLEQRVAVPVEQPAGVLADDRSSS